MVLSDAYRNVLHILTYGELTDGSAEVTGFEPNAPNNQNISN